MEFALVLPLLVLMLFGMIQFGLLFNAYISVNHAAREGARMAAVGTFSASEVKARATPLKPAQIVVVGPLLHTSASLGDYYEVTVSYPYALHIPLWGDRALTVKATAKMRKEN